jgi:hypothetical protein
VAEPGAIEPSTQLVLEGGPGVIGGERDAHAQSLAVAAGRNGVAVTRPEG